MMRVLLVLAAASALAACSGSSNDSEQAAKPAAQAQATPAQKTVLDPQLKALQTAKDVQKTVDAEAARTDQAIEGAEGGNDGKDGDGKDGGG